MADWRICMIALSPDKETLIFSVGKTGSTALIDALNTWKTVGEDNLLYGEWMPDCHTDDLGRHFISQKETLEEIVNHYNPQITFIVREPYSRFISGMKEIAQDYISVLGNNNFNQLWFDVIDDKKMCTDLISRIFYLGEFKTTPDYAKIYNYDWHRSFSVFHNYHTKNWLSNTVLQYPDARIIDNKNLNGFMEELGVTPISKNVSKLKEIETIKHGVENCDVKHLIDKYLQPEIAAYNKIIR